MYTVKNTTDWLTLPIFIRQRSIDFVRRLPEDVYSAVTSWKSSRYTYSPTGTPTHLLRFPMAFSLSFPTNPEKILQMNQNHSFTDIFQLIIY